MSYLVNPYMVSSAQPNMSDSDLKTYLKFDEASGNIVNNSLSSESLGTAGQLDDFGGGFLYSRSDSNPANFGNACGLGSNTIAWAGANGGSVTSDWTFLHNVNCQWTINWWMNLQETPSDGDWWIGTGGNQASQIGFKLCMNGENSLLLQMSYGAGTNLWVGRPSSNADIIDQSVGWHMITARWNQLNDHSDAENSNFYPYEDGVFKVAQSFGNKSSDDNVDTDPTNALQLGVSPFSVVDLCNAYWCELSIWDRLLTDEFTGAGAEDNEIWSLWNDGAGLEIY